jgi:hypothetical protein
MMTYHHHHHHHHHLSPIRLFLWMTYFLSYIIIASFNLTATIAITTLTLTTIATATTTTATATIHLNRTVSSSIDNRYDDRRRVDTIPANKYHRTMKHSPESIEIGGHTNSKQGLNNPKQGLNNPKQQGIRYPTLDNTNPSTVNHQQTITASVAGSSPRVSTIIHSNHHTLLDHKTSSSSSSSSSTSHNHNHHHHHHRNEISNITICPHTYPFPAVEGALLSNSMKGT